jgi:hypothetical protein
MKPWVQWLIAFTVFCHGFVYVRIGSMLPAPVKGWTGRSWLLGDAISDSQLTKSVVPLHMIPGMTCAIAIGMPSLLPGWWPARYSRRGARHRRVCRVLGWSARCICVSSHSNSF